MKIALQALERQVIVIVGATGTIARLTARGAARRGARLVLAAARPEALDVMAAELRAGGAQAVAVLAEPADPVQLRRVAATAIECFGAIDGWVNCAGVPAHRRPPGDPATDRRRALDAHYWGVVHGSLIAVEQLRRRGGAVVNVGSTPAMPRSARQRDGAWAADAVKGFVDSLRLEIEEERLPVSVTLIRPGPPDPASARRHGDRDGPEAGLPLPLFAPELAATAILHALEHVRREITVGATRLAVAPRVPDANRGTARPVSTFPRPLQALTLIAGALLVLNASRRPHR